MTMAFSQIDVPTRSDKPRKDGITSLIDWGMPLGAQKDMLASTGHLIDMAKVGGCVARFMPRDLLCEKLAAYNELGISASPGGVFFELAFKQGNYEYFLEEARDVGFTSFEVSDTLLDLTPAEKIEAIKAASAAGFKTISEVGKKSDEMDDSSILADIELSLNYADFVILEANEFFENGNIREALIDTVSDRYDQSRLLWELPVSVLPGSSRAIKEKVSHWLVSRFGTRVNLANVEAEEIYFSEGVRSGAGGDTSFELGAYRLAGFPASP
ncbi:phosphosulfolactate synthase [Sulfitobacter sp. 20_GPM-1509m]|uniref:phosphosulfolactate synthase n=1 Tax=Sulfitobacter sp. 20_GPM-1509m TaxID=1380367 RepID=UPI00048FBC3B|nr:phosphosulfolactate synthase [Sulfitobacter sp. 20_GPM-1509m]